MTAAELAGVDRNLAPGATCAVTPLPDGVARFAFTFPAETGRWGYPRWTLPAGTSFIDHDAVVMRVRCQAKADVRLFVFEADGAGWFTPAALVPADGRWHWAVVRLRELEHCTYTIADASGALEPGRIRQLSLGLNSYVDGNILEIASLELVRLGD